MDLVEDLVTPLKKLILEARRSAVPSPAEVASRVTRGHKDPRAVGLTAEELAARCRERGYKTIYRETISRAERVGPREPTMKAILDTLGLDIDALTEREKAILAEFRRKEPK